MNEKVCFKGDGTTDTGIKIINALVKLGGKIPIGMSGCTANYYFIKWGVEWSQTIPEGYILANPDDYLNEKPYPRWMWVSDKDEKEAKSCNKEYVIGKFKHPNNGTERFVSICSEKGNTWTSCSWKLAFDIEEPTEQELIKMEIEELRAKLDELERRVK